MKIGVLGLPRTGTSATYWLLQAALPAATCCLFEPQDEPAWQAHQDTLVKMLVSPLPDRAGPPAAWLKHLDACVIVHRDPRDRLISSLLFLLHWSGHGYAPLWEQAGFDGLLRWLGQKEQSPGSVPIWPFFEAVYAARFGMQAHAAQGWLASQQAHLLAYGERFPAMIHVGYEALIAGALPHVERTLKLPLPLAIPGDPRQRSIKREGKSGAWRHWFTADDCAYFAWAFAPYCAAMDYQPTQAKALAKTPTIDPVTSSRYVQKWVRVQRRASQHAAS